MKIITKQITIRELVDGFVDKGDKGAFAYSGKLVLRPSYQRNFCYTEAKQNAVWATIISELPLGLLYWTEETDENGNVYYQCLDGQQRSISICNYISSILKALHFTKDEMKYFPELYPYNNLPYENLDNNQKEKILNYVIDVKIIEGSDMETKLAYFARLNIAGVTLENQELLNAIYCGTFTEDAKAYFSRKNSEGTKKRDLIDYDENRQLILEKALEWITDKNNPNEYSNSPAEYMKLHRNDKNARALITEFENICHWAKQLFRGIKTSKITKNKDWGRLYYTYKDVNYSDRDLVNEAEELYKNEDVKRSNIVEYLLSGKESLLQARSFDRGLVEIKLKEQDCCCAICGKVISLEEAQGDHIIALSKGGKTKVENLQVLCAECNNKKSDD